MIGRRLHVAVGYSRSRLRRALRERMTSLENVRLVTRPGRLQGIDPEEVEILWLGPRWARSPVAGRGRFKRLRKAARVVKRL